MGSEDFETLKQELAVSKDPKYSRQLECIARAIIPHIPQDNDPDTWEIVVFESDALNAFALPGRKIGFYKGIMDFVDNQDQLAAIFGHEVAHVLANHGNERVSQNTLKGIGLQALSLGLSLGTGLNQESVSSIVNLSVLSLNFAFLLPYSRSHESEADTLGLRYMAQAGFDPAQASKLWQKMGDVGGSSTPEFLSTHPAPESRSESLAKQAKTLEPVLIEARKNGQNPQCHL